MAAQPLLNLTARPLPLRGDDIDTDRIIPARFLRCVVFDGIGEHAFEDDRKGLKAKGQIHPFEDARFAGAGLLIVNKNFGCGSSREHAPQALMRAGVKALVGESFAEIFFGNCVSLGIPCVTASAVDLETLQSMAEKQPEGSWTLDLSSQSLSVAGKSFSIQQPEGARKQFLSGRWNPMDELLSDPGSVADTAHQLPYVNGFANGIQTASAT
jgi:3-isopropylmalate/(R)-2-methylmalate dehydratase small subunit